MGNTENTMNKGEKLWWLALALASVQVASRVLYCQWWCETQSLRCWLLFIFFFYCNMKMILISESDTFNTDARWSEKRSTWVNYRWSDSFLCIQMTSSPAVCTHDWLLQSCLKLVYFLPSSDSWLTFSYKVYLIELFWEQKLQGPFRSCSTALNHTRWFS